MTYVAVVERRYGAKSEKLVNYRIEFGTIADEEFMAFRKKMEFMGYKEQIVVVKQGKFSEEISTLDHDVFFSNKFDEENWLEHRYSKDEYVHQF